MGSFVWATVGIEGGADNDAELLAKIDGQATERLLAAGLQALAVLLIGVVLWYLNRATKYRRPETPVVTLVLVVAGPILYAIVSVLIQLAQLDAASDFVSSGPRTEERAEDLLREGSVRTLGLIGLAPSLALGFAFVLLNLNAMRAGLVSRFMGILGIIIGGLYVLPILFGGPQLILLFWLGAMGMLFLDRWPTGRGPAWEAGRAVAWPSAAEQRLAREGSPPPEPAEAALAADPDTPQEAPARRKRKRKRR